jgi:enoyl-CoA hydratase/carnithine racemase
MNFRPNDRVSIDLEEDGVAQVRLIRADKMNALDGEMFDRLIETGQALQNMKGLRAVVLAGEGRAFCAGLDLSSFGRNRGDEPPLTERTFGNANRAQQVAMQWRKLPVPVVAAVHGVCFGGGLQIASGADIRIVAPNTRMAVMEMRWGLVPDMGGIALWRGLVRDDVLRELTFTNREFTGAEALTLGLATYVEEDPLTRATEIARTIADRNPHAMRGAKRLINAMADKNTADLLMEESLEQHPLLGSKNQIEAVMAGMEKRKARYEDV